MVEPPVRVVSAERDGGRLHDHSERDQPGQYAVLSEISGGQPSAWSRHIVLPSLSLNQAARPRPFMVAIEPSHSTPGMS